MTTVGSANQRRTLKIELINKLELQKMWKKWFAILIGITFLTVIVPSNNLKAQANDWTEPFPPFKIAGNLYYVGSKGLANYLITTPKGHILINSDMEENVPLIRASVEKLGDNLRLHIPGDRDVIHCLPSLHLGGHRGPHLLRFVREE